MPVTTKAHRCHTCGARRKSAGACPECASFRRRMGLMWAREPKLPAHDPGREARIELYTARAAARLPLCG